MAALLLCVGLGCGDDSGGGDESAAAAGTTAPAAGTTAGAAAAAPTGTAGAAAGTGGAAAGATPPPMLCPADPGITQCGGAACPAPTMELMTLCVQTCCTAANTCGTINAILGGTCMEEAVNTSMCPDELIMNNMVSGCCVDGTNQCGIIDPIAGMGCLARNNPLVTIFAPLEPLNCDGTPVMTTTAGMGGEAGMAGAAGTAGTGGAAGMTTPDGGV